MSKVELMMCDLTQYHMGIPIHMQGATARNSVELVVSFGYYFFCPYLAFGECCESVP